MGHEQDPQKERAVSEGLDPERMPRHIAFIMDGNGRWAEGKGLTRAEGHSVGVESVREIIRCAGEIGIGILTFFGFSTENWKRPKREVAAIMRLIVESLRGAIDEVTAQDIRVSFLGRWDELPRINQQIIRQIMEQTAGNNRLLLNVALNYGGRQEIVAAAQSIAMDVQAGKLDPEVIDEPLFASYLYTENLPDPDLLIRTSGEMRISNFLLYQLAYTEILVSPVFWPDFSRNHFIRAIKDYQSRERRFGLTGGQVSSNST